MWNFLDRGVGGVALAWRDLHNDLPQGPFPLSVVLGVRKKRCSKRAAAAAMVTTEPGLAQPDSVQPAHDHFSYYWSNLGRAVLMFQPDNAIGCMTLP